MRIVPAPQVVEGGGFVVRRPFPVQGLSHVDPFLLIDEMGPVDYAPGKAIGAPDHPHRGFETVTYIIDGAMEHEDSHGHRGAIRAGDVQWMTAGAGVIHSEMPERSFFERGGLMHGFQIWVNLPRDKKMSAPRYQEYDSAHLPVIEEPGLWMRIIAGRYGSAASPIETTVPVTMMHVKLQPGAQTTIATPEGANAIVHTIEGSGHMESTALQTHDVGIAANAPGTVHLSASAEQAFEALVLSGKPLGEPVARHGPFVMSTREELQQAFEDFHAGRFGEIARVN